MIEYKDGDLLESGAGVIVHQVNCMGKFASGLAAQIREKWPLVYHEYTRICDKEYDYPVSLLGSIQLVGIGKGYVANCFGQLSYGRKGQFTDYKALESALEYVREFASTTNMSIAIPYKIGCGLGGGDWAVVEPMIKRVFADYDGTVTIYKIKES